MTRNYSLEGKLNQSADLLKIGGFGGMILSSFLLLSPAKNVGFIGMGAGASAVAATIISKGRYLKAIESHLDEIKSASESELKAHSEQVYNLSGEVKRLNSHVSQLSAEKEGLNSELEQTKELLVELGDRNDYYKAEWEKATQRIEESIAVTRQAVEECLDEWTAKLTNLTSRKTDYGKLIERLAGLLEEGQERLAEYGLKLAQSKNKVSSLDDLLSLYFCINDDMTNIKTKMINSINVLSLQERELSLDESYGSYESLKTKYIKLQGQLNETIRECNRRLVEESQNAKAIIEEFNVVANSEVEKTWTENEEFFKRLKETIQSLENVIKELKGKIDLLSKPLEYRPATRTDMKVANIFIRYFHALGVILDRAGSDYRGHDATLWFFLDRNERLILADELNEHSDKLQALAHTLNSPTFKLDPESGLIHVTVSLSKKPAVNETDISLIVGNADEFIAYVTSNPIRYRLIADPGMGKSPTAAVMLSEILKVGCKRGNVPKGSKVPYTLVTVSYPGVQSSLKDTDYPLDLFLEYGTEASAVKSFQVALEDWEYRRKNIPYAERFFQLWVWDEFDNTVNSSSDPQALADRLKLLLKQGGHNNIGWIVSGQSVMTKQIPGFTNDDRSLFTEIIIGIPKIRHYLNTYGKGKNSDSNLAKLSRNLEQIEEYIEQKNELVTDDARLLRVALVVDSRSPKLYFLPNLDCVSFDANAVEETRRLAAQFRDGSVGMAVSRSIPANAPIADIASASSLPLEPEKLPIGGRESKPHCPECGSANVKPQSQKRYKCADCSVRRVESKMVWK